MVVLHDHDHHPLPLSLSPFPPLPPQDEVVEDLDRDHQQELKRIVFSLELKRIRWAGGDIWEEGCRGGLSARGKEVGSVDSSGWVGGLLCACTSAAGPGNAPCFSMC